MTDERRYGEDEARAIFDAAAREVDPAGEGSRGPGDGRGMTLAELQDIGDEVGLARERIAEAARRLDAGGGAVGRRERTLLGAQLSVSRVVELPRAPDDREWDALVGELRRTFGARGKVEGFRQEWWNGNLHACVEPSGAGYRLRLGTLKGNAVPLTLAGTAMLALALAVLVAGLAGTDDGGVFSSILLGAMGVGLLGGGVLGLPRWARTRERQMEHIAERAVALLGEPETPSAP